MAKRFAAAMVLVLVISAFSTVCFAAVVVEGSGSQVRGTPGHNAELHGDLFTLPRYGTITNITSDGASGFWIEKGDGTLVINFDTMKQAMGYGLPAGSYRIFPNLKENPKANHAHVTITITCP